MIDTILLLCYSVLLCLLVFYIDSLEEISPEWQATSVVRHVDDPYSAAALAEAEKTCIDLGPIDMDRCRGGWGYAFKERGQEARIYPSTPAGLVEAHQLFIGAARLILGDERYLVDSSIHFTYRDDPVLPGGAQVATRPHIDGPSRMVNDLKQLTLLGIACNALPTDLMQGPLDRSQLERGDLRSLLNLNKRFKANPIPVNRLLLTPPSLMHRPGVAEHGLAKPVERLFLRWSLSI